MIILYLFLTGLCENLLLCGADHGVTELFKHAILQYKFCVREKEELLSGGERSQGVTNALAPPVRHFANTPAAQVASKVDNKSLRNSSLIQKHRAERFSGRLRRFRRRAVLQKPVNIMSTRNT